MKESFLKKFGLFSSSGPDREEKPLPENIRNHDALCRFIVESAHDAIYIIGKDFRVEYANARVAADFRLAVEDIVGKSLEELFPGDIFKSMRIDIDQVFRTRQPLSFEHTLPFKDKQVHSNTVLVPLVDGGGAVSSVLGISRHITGRRESDHPFINSDELYRTLIETSPDAITVSDLEGKIIKASKRSLEMYGYGSEEEVTGISAFEFIAPEDHERARLNLLKTLEQGTIRNCEYLLRKKDGTLFFGELNSSVVRDSRGAPRAFIGITRDITEHKRTEKALQESERRFKELWDNAPVAYHTLDTKGVITRVNHTEARMLGYFVEEMVGKPVFNFILPEQRQDARERFQQKLANQNVSKSENRVYMRKDGSLISVSIDDVIEYDDTGAVAGVRTTMVDITGRRRAEEKLTQSLEKLQQTMESTVQAMAKIVEMKDPYTAGHQKRVAKLAAAIARENGLPEEQVDGIHMAAVIHDIGKIYVPSEILSKPGKLTDIEFGMIKTHPKVSYDILKMVEFPWPIAKIVIQHHERINGSGYPLGLAGEDIMVEAKILSVADVVEAVAFHRPYRSAVGIHKALEEIAVNRGVLYDPRAVDACLRLFNEKGFTFD